MPFVSYVELRYLRRDGSGGGGYAGQAERKREGTRGARDPSCRSRSRLLGYA